MTQPVGLSVAVIGVGAAGLAAVATLRRKFRVTAYEISDRAGGVWNYRPDPHSGQVYRDLSTNLPKEVMAFPDWEWREADGRSFVPHARVLAYLRSFCYDQGLDAHIRFGRRVVSVRPGESGPGWVVETLEDGSEAFDAVVLANGHFAKPMVPQLPGIGSFPEGRLSHSSSYRHAELFRGQTVALLGASSSGQDIALELATAAGRVYLCHRGPALKSALPENVTQLGPIEEFLAEGTVLCRRLPPCESDEPVKLRVDHVMFCTGYDYQFPFLDRRCVPVEASHVPGLYMHVAHTQRSGLYFLGLCTTIAPFPQFQLQAGLVEALLEGRIKLPSDAAVASAQETAAKLGAGLAPRHLHTLADEQWAYNDMLADLAGVPRLPPVIRLIYDHVKVERSLRLKLYKRVAYRVTGPDTFETFLVD